MRFEIGLKIIKSACRFKKSLKINCNIYAASIALIRFPIIINFKRNNSQIYGLSTPIKMCGSKTNETIEKEIMCKGES